MEYKDRIRKAVSDFYEKQSRVNSGPKRKNGKPEKILEHEVTRWLKSKDIAFSVVESKAVYSKSAGRYLNGQTQEGFSDIVGLDKHGNFIAIELKAPGRRSTLRPAQRVFLNDRISRGGFCACIDSLKLLDETYTEWLKTKSKEFLLKSLPPEKSNLPDDKPLFDDCD